MAEAATRVNVKRKNAEIDGQKIDTLTLQWLALSLTPGLGPTRARKLVEFMGGIQAVFQASLTDLEATGLQAMSAQALGTGRSIELAHDELGRVAAEAVELIGFDDPGYPGHLKQIYDPPL